MAVSGDLATSGVPASGIVFTGCGLEAAAPAADSHGHGHDHAGPRRRETVINGKRVKTIDIHAHCAVPAAMALINHPLEAPAC